MPCLYPLQAFRDNFMDASGCMRSRMRFAPTGDIQLPCGRCIACRLEHSRQVAMRCVHEAKLYEDNCFVTLTFDDEHLAKMCPLKEGGYSLVRDHASNFMKRLRQKFSDGFVLKDRDGEERFHSSFPVRAFGCGEYGGKDGRPHYHFCLFNCGFSDRVFYKRENGFEYYNSDVLSSLWKFGFAVVTDFSFETAAYVARYCTKKITGKKADSHYLGRLPEFPVYPTRGGGIGKPWFDLFWKSDLVPTDVCIVNGARSKVPRYYDKLRDRVDSIGLKVAKDLRAQRAVQKSSDNTWSRLRTKEKCLKARFNLLVRKLEL